MRATLLIYGLFLHTVPGLGDGSGGVSLVSRREGVILRSGPGREASPLRSLSVGERVVGKARRGMVWEVEGGGFVFVTDVSREASRGGLSEALRADAAANRDEAGDARRRTAVMGIRGLREGGGAESAASVRPNSRAVFAMEDYKVPDTSIIRWLVDREVEERVRAVQDADSSK